MKTELLPASETANLVHAAEVLRGGGLVAFPTDTVYGLAAAAFDPVAVTSIYAVKDRPNDKAIPILLPSISQLGLVSSGASPTALRLAERCWPGPLTIVVPTHPRVPEVVSAGTVGVRVPDHPVALAILDLTGPLAVTSANVSGQQSPTTATEVLDQLNGRLSLIIDGGRTPGGRASTVVDCTGKALKILREGPLTLDMLEKELD